MLQISEIETKRDIKEERVVKREKNVRGNVEMDQCKEKADYLFLR